MFVADADGRDQWQGHPPNILPAAIQSAKQKKNADQPDRKCSNNEFMTKHLYSINLFNSK